MTNPFYRNIPFIMENAPKFLGDLKYEYLGYEGADGNLLWGGCGWFQVQSKFSGSILTVQLRRQGSSLKWIFDREVDSLYKVR